ncbi:hypothetical protein AY610_04360 [Bacillus velezensis]|nr:hypothetical protein AY610_04360 [Bacillus velezensis]
MNKKRMNNLAIVPLIISSFAALISLSSYFLTRKNLQINDAPRLIASNIKKRLENQKVTISFEVKNYGKGVALKTFLIITVKGGNKKGDQHYLSKPLVTLEPGKTGVLEIVFKKKETEDQISGAILVSQDFFDNFHITETNLQFNNQHLKEFSKPVKQISKILRMCTHRRIRKMMNLASDQGNTAVDRKQKEQKEIIEELQKAFRK